MKLARPLAFLTCAIALVTAYACQDDGAVAPRPWIGADLDPVFPDSGAALGSSGAPTPVDNEQAFTSYQKTGVTLPSGVAIRVSATAKLTFTPNSRFTECSGLAVPALPGNVTQVGPAGLDYPNRPYQVNVGVGTATSPPGGALAWQPLSATADSVGAITFGAGVLWVSRPVVYHSSCNSQQTGYQPAYTVSGAQTISATVLPPPVIVVDRTTVVNGDTVTAHPTASWTSNIIVRYGREWVADPAPTGGSATFVPGSGCGLRDLTCRVVPHGDGHLRMPDLLMLGRFYQTAVSPTIHVAPARLVLVVDSSHVASGSQVKFTARRGDGQQTVQVQSWVWTPGSTSPVGPLAVDCAGGDSLCVTVLQNTSPADSTGVAQTGTMMAMAYLGTAAESASVAVTVDRPVAGGGCSSPAIGSSGSATRTASATRTVSKVGTPPRLSLSCVGGGGGSTGDTIHLSIDRDTLNPLYPRIRFDVVNGDTVYDRPPDTANVQVTVYRDGHPVSADAPSTVTIRAEWLPGTGGHAHIAKPVGFQDAPRLTTGPESGYGLLGYFFTAPNQKKNAVATQTNSNGLVTTKLVAGYVGGRASVIATAAVNGKVLAETVFVAYAVPGLVKLQDSITADVYWIGGTNDHHQGDNFYVQPRLVAGMTAIAESLKKTGSTTLYAQYNDASLPNGGTFTVKPAPVTFENPYIGTGGGHVSHDRGLDMDIGLCLTDTPGDGGNWVHRVEGRYDQYANPQTQCMLGSQLLTDTARVISHDRLTNVAGFFSAIARVHPDTSNGNHFHIHFR